MKSPLPTILFFLALILTGRVVIAWQSPAMNPTLLDAIRANDINRARGLLEGGANPNGRDANGASALMYAALYGGPGILNLLIRAGADLTLQDENGLTALGWAAHSKESAQVLLDAGADVNAKSKLGATPLMIAAAYPGNSGLLRSILEKGANVDVPVLGATALTLAALTGDGEGVGVLLDHGANPNQSGPGGFAPLHLAMMRGDRAMVKRLLDAGANADIRDSQEEDPLERYGLWNDPQLVRMLLDRGTSPTRKDKRNHNAVLFAASSYTVTPEVFSMLLRGGPPTGARTAYGDDALEAARRRGDGVLAKLLGGTVPAIAQQQIAPISAGRPQIQAAISAGLDLLARTGPSVVNQRGCVSCHHQSLPSLAEWYTRRSGMPGTRIAELNRKLVYPLLQRSNLLMQHGVAPAGEAGTVAWELIGLSSDGEPADLFTDVAVNYLAATQMQDGSWLERFGRPPLEYSAVSATAVAIRALDLYRIPSRRQEFDDRIGRATDWLAKTEPLSPEERPMRLLGLVWGRASRATIDKAARALASAQQPDGGWRQLPSLGCDAYATGQTLVALRESGHYRPDSPACIRGVKYLLGTQEDDGSWHVTGRALPILPLFETGFPHGRDQWISAAGTSWAVMGLSLALPSRKGSNPN